MKHYFETERSYIRNFIEEDLIVFMEYRNNMDWMKYQKYKGLSMDQYRQDLLGDFNIEKGGQLAIISKESHGILGDIYLHKNNNEIQLGYAIHPMHTKKGYITEVISKLIEKLRNDYPGATILADADSLNIPSIKILKKRGFEFIRVIENCTYFKYDL